MKNKFDSLFFAISCSEMRIIMSFTFLNQLPSPAEIKRDFPLSEELKQYTLSYSEDYYDLESYDESYDEGMIPEATNDGTME